jgi:hypothetical protein
VSARGLALALLVALAPVAAAAGEAEEGRRPVEVTVGTRAWLASGHFTWGFAGVASGAPVKPLSELRWRGVDALVSEVSLDVVLWQRLVLSGAFGRGDDHGGVLIDDDFALDDHQGRFSHTRSRVEGDLTYARGDVGVRLLRWGDGHRGWLDLLVGYQYWHEKLEAFGLQGFVDLSPFGLNLQFPSAVGGSIKVITHDYYFNSVRLGLRSHVPIVAGLGARLGFFVLPYSSFRLDDVHSLRGDLKKNPSFVSEQRGGFGVQATAGLAYAWGPLRFEAGVELWHLHAGRGGEKTARLRSGDLDDRLTELSAERWGPYLGVQYRF